MKKIFLVLLLLLFFNSLFAQEKTDSLVFNSLIETGIEYHDQRQYEKAIEMYEQALKIYPESPLAHYEIALTYMEMKEYEKTIEHSDIVIKQAGKYLLPAYIAKGSSLDYLGRMGESIALFEDGIEKFGGHYLLYYNLGVDYYNISNNVKAEEAFINAIKTNVNHTSSHMLLGTIKSEQKQRVQSLLCLYYFLFLEPNTSRSVQGYALLQNQLRGNVQVNEENPSSINVNVFMNPDEQDSGFGAADLMISMIEASNHTLEENKNKTAEELFIESTKSFLLILGELNENEDREESIWWDFYVPFLYEIAKSEHLDTFCYYISQSSSENAAEWIAKNESRLDAFDSWLSKE